MIFRFDFKRNFPGLIVWSLFVSALAVLLLFFHKVFIGSFQPEAFAAKVSALPGLIRGILGLAATPDLSHEFQFIAYAFQFLLLFAGIYAGLIGAKALAGEEGRGTIEFIYSLPVSRGSILRQKLISGIIRYIIFCGVVYAATCVAVWFFNKDMHISGVVTQLIRLNVCLLGSGFVYMALGFLVSSLFRSNAESVSVILAIVLITYIIGMMGNIMPHLRFLTYISPIHAQLPLNALNNGLGIIAIVMGAFVIAIALVLTSLRYRGKDFLV